MIRFLLETVFVMQSTITRFASMMEAIAVLENTRSAQNAMGRCAIVIVQAYANASPMV